LCCSVLQCLRCVAVSFWQCRTTLQAVSRYVTACCGVSRCCVLRCVVGVLRCVAVCCSVFLTMETIGIVHIATTSLQLLLYMTATNFTFAATGAAFRRQQRRSMYCCNLAATLNLCGCNSLYIWLQQALHIVAIITALCTDAAHLQLYNSPAALSPYCCK